MERTGHCRNNELFLTCRMSATMCDLLLSSTSITHRMCPGSHRMRRGFKATDLRCFREARPLPGPSLSTTRRLCVACFARSIIQPHRYHLRFALSYPRSHVRRVRTLSPYISMLNANCTGPVVPSRAVRTERLVMPFRVWFLSSQRAFFISHLLFCYPVFVLSGARNTLCIYPQRIVLLSVTYLRSIHCAHYMRLFVSGIGRACHEFAPGRSRLLTARG
jgi:hypothetical protein